MLCPGLTHLEPTCSRESRGTPGVSGGAACQTPFETLTSLLHLTLTELSGRWTVTLPVTDGLGDARSTGLAGAVPEIKPRQPFAVPAA